MTLSKLFSLAIVTFVLVLAGNADAQQSYSHSWSNQSSWNSSYSSGPNGTHVSGNQASRQQSQTTVVDGNRSVAVNQDHSQTSGYARGFDGNGSYDSRYAQQQGQTNVVDQRRYSGSAGSLTRTQAVQQNYNNQQGYVQTLGPQGYNFNGYNSQSASQTTVNDLRGNILGRNVGQGQVQTIGFNRNQSFQMGLNPLGQQSMNFNQSGSTFDRGRIYRWID